MKMKTKITKDTFSSVLPSESWALRSTEAVISKAKTKLWKCMNVVFFIESNALVVLQNTLDLVVGARGLRTNREAERCCCLVTDDDACYRCRERGCKTNGILITNESLMLMGSRRFQYLLHFLVTFLSPPIDSSNSSWTLLTTTRPKLRAPAGKLDPSLLSQAARQMLDRLSNDEQKRILIIELLVQLTSNVTKQEAELNASKDVYLIGNEIERNLELCRDCQIS